ncbi:MAG: RnfABCDGE type electron transport complex subunit D [Clostridia bacterium]
MTNKKNSPYIRTNETTYSVMLDVIIACIPLLIWAMYIFGARSTVIVLVSVLSALGFDCIFTRIIRKKNHTFDLSPIITGMLIGFAMPVSVPLWLPIFASAVAIIVAKQAFGGVGKNIFNPAASGICASAMIFSNYMSTFTKPFTYFSTFAINLPQSEVESARVMTSLDLIRKGTVESSALANYFYGISPGTIGEISVLLIALGFLYLLSKRTIPFNGTFAYLTTFVVLTFFTAYADSEPIDFALMQLFSGGTIIIAVFFINDYSTTPTTAAGKLSFAVICASLAVGIRYYGNVHYADYFALLIVNMLVPIIEKATTPRVFGNRIKAPDQKLSTEKSID